MQYILNYSSDWISSSLWELQSLIVWIQFSEEKTILLLYVLLLYYTPLKKIFPPCRYSPEVSLLEAPHVLIRRVHTTLTDETLPWSCFISRCSCKLVVMISASPGEQLIELEEVYTRLDSVRVMEKLNLLWHLRQKLGFLLTNHLLPVHKNTLDISSEVLMAQCLRLNVITRE